MSRKLKVHCFKNFLTQREDALDDRFVSGAVVPTEDRITVGLGFYNGRGNFLLNVEIPVTKGVPEVTASERAFEMLDAIKGIVDTTRTTLYKELSELVAGSETNETTGNNRGPGRSGEVIDLSSHREPTP